MQHISIRSPSLSIATFHPLRIASRSSPLARAQVKECLTLLQAHYPALRFTITYVETHGDIDLKRSLRDMGQTDFFTREVDTLVLTGACDLAIHSAKDLPNPLPEGLTCVALTRCVDSTDSLVMRAEDTLHTLPLGARIATSSLRREAEILKLRPDLTCIDVRGPIAERLAYLEDGRAEGVVVAHAALIRLQLDMLNYMTLPGQTTPLQGQLAVIAKQTRLDMAEFMAPIDVRRQYTVESKT